MTSVVPIQNGINFRDLGGIKTSDGRQIRSGMLYRSGEFSRLSDEEKKFLSDELNLHYVLDYRDQLEIDRNPDNLWNNSQYFNIPANPLSDEITASLVSDDIFVLKKYSPLDFMIKLYQLLPFNNPAYKKLISILLNANGKPLVQHCAVGKDRTGVGVALTLFALGVSEDVVMQDYLLTEQYLNDYRQAVLSQNKSKLSAEEFEKQKIIFSAKQEFLTAAIDEIKKRYNTIDNWLHQEYQLDDNNRKILQDIYLI
ncbi:MULTISPECIES: tyrosine-protein phosphatase [Gilliamella]|uniref:Protein-tyrosine-phosphatase n=1 Tax=Gilliamella apis TaxID=1970738 RepID=A0A2V4DPS5_9GAMM|nr:MULTISPECIES: tyrosine-protein phosphatase [Gilliamella]MBI0037586.1 tyrosine-protein phosphatase [Gilliamella sp. B14384G10]MBI0040483.1 tyrosine-protein phosphatase [Gilliamella sp. B14384G7]MBI0052322.1 tyrosine-protein phosphatase [Gilliamella sp. B14384G13]MBI0053873.1 tyrosine-protein phosphatase [Gilliamella sp. B14384H2]PXY92614.1 protein-tyrosine-phosphatase [Gilliamella apis]